jgi:hypothetical protein
MKCDYSCQTSEHLIARRQFLGGITGGFVAGGLGALTTPVFADQLKQNNMRVLVVNMAGGLSQLESWDPKPKTDTGGPFRAIQTAVPGTQICELLPKTALHMDKLSLIRSINKAATRWLTGAIRCPALSIRILEAFARKRWSVPTVLCPVTSKFQADREAATPRTSARNTPALE